MTEHVPIHPKPLSPLRNKITLLFHFVTVKKARWLNILIFKSSMFSVLIYHYEPDMKYNDK